MKRLLLAAVLFLSLFGSGCISGSAQTTTDTAPDLYDGDRFVGKVFSFNGDKMTVWIPHMDAFVFLNYDWQNATAGFDMNLSRIEPEFASNDCTGQPHAHWTRGYSAIVTNCDKQEWEEDREGLCNTYYLDAEMKQSAVEPRSRMPMGMCLPKSDPPRSMAMLQPVDFGHTIDSPSIR